MSYANGPVPRLAVALALGALVADAAGESVDPFDLGEQYAYSANAGWINAEPGGDGGRGAQLNLGEASGWLWSENLGWISLSCRNTTSCSEVAYGIHSLPEPEGEVWNSGARFEGYAWSENAGWISFSCRNTNSCDQVPYGVRADVDSGVLTGFAWSENLGWISFDCESTASCAEQDFKLSTGPGLLSDGLFQDSYE